MNLIKLNAVLFTGVVLAGCGGNSNVKPVSKVDTGINISSLNIQQSAGLAQGGPLDQVALSEC
ncbi:MAG: hypothetical protein U9R28_01425, partial [Pseudomonadota bacterium]|nr:hypothetical protein [Pseudomonadota bacterium]